MTMQPLTFASVPYLVILPGRTSCVALCHVQPGTCQRCLGEIAKVLAMEMQHDLNEAVNRTTQSYQAECGGEPMLTLEQARELRRLTVRVCSGWKHGQLRDMVLADMVLADNDLPEEDAAAERRARSAWRLGIFCLWNVLMWASLILVAIFRA